ncbi:hypothetical protein [Haloarcula marismortui]|uniref:Uncharacterized protein n=2 Tax=Haloarcula marismortui ATCC 33800 TaxID=662476 RepID=A0A8T8KH56_9EURY|nr:hypothetical protein [Haloarcula sinaiiensis]QUJ74468.1 hypothetical protein KDQ40_20650 [Haloarcula sinaiiensis ATCC 33800]
MFEAMPEIEITDTQQADLTAIQEDLEDAFIETYGHIRTQDVVDYLLDTYTPPDQLEGEQGLSRPDYERIASAEYPELQRIASEVSEVPGSGIDADEMRGKLLSALGTSELATRLADVESETKADEGDKEGATGPDNSADAAGDGHDSTQTDTSGQAGPAPDTVETGDAAEPNNAPGDTLSVANRLLTEHDEKWTRSNETDEPYEVTLPDGSTVSARTKDDVRKLLFQNY